MFSYLFGEPKESEREAKLKALLKQQQEKYDRLLDTYKAYTEATTASFKRLSDETNELRKTVIADREEARREREEATAMIRAAKEAIMEERKRAAADREDYMKGIERERQQMQEERKRLLDEVARERALSERQRKADQQRVQDEIDRAKAKANKQLQEDRKKIREQFIKESEEAAKEVAKKKDTRKVVAEEDLPEKYDGEYYNMDAIMDVVKKYYETHKGYSKFGFQSYLLKKPVTVVFENESHANNWFQTLDIEGIDSQHDGTLRASESKPTILGGVRDVHLLEDRGGCRRISPRPIKGIDGKYVVAPVPVKGNKCGIYSILYFVKGAEYAATESLRILKEVVKEGVVFDEGIARDDLLKAIAVITAKYDYTRPIQVIDSDYTGVFNSDTTDYIMFHGDHYAPVLSFTKKASDKRIRKGAKRNTGVMTFDIETRHDDNYVVIKGDKKLSERDMAVGLDVDPTQDRKVYKLKDAITHCYYRNYQSDDCVHVSFETDQESSSVKKFIQFLKQQSKAGHYYRIVGHNAGNFDFYFVKDELNEKELELSDIKLRQSTIMAFNLYGHEFKDSCLFMNFSLHTLCENFKVGDLGKVTELDIHGTKLTNVQLCFYKPELPFFQFMDLKKTDPEFWEKYNYYCKMDCISLFAIWEKFKQETNALLASAGNSKHIDTYLTIGAAAKSTFLASVKYRHKNESLETYKNRVKAFESVLRFIQKDGEVEKDGDPVDDDKYKFIREFIRGGISHCNRPGYYTEGIASCDVASEYPASMMYMKIPAGKSKLVNDYSDNYHGFFHITDLKFADNAPSFKPVCNKSRDDTLKWNTHNHIHDAYCDNHMIDYLKKHCGLLDFKVAQGYVSGRSVKGSVIFGPYVNTFYNEKMRQDKLRKDGNPSFNNVIRECCKLFLNSLGGKMVEFSDKYNTLVPTKETTNVVTINGVNFKEESVGKHNSLITLGVMIYSHSKRLIHSYCRMLPRGVDSFIHIETDSIYMERADADPFEHALSGNKEGLDDYPLAIGALLGNVKWEHMTSPGEDAYFLMKKSYYLEDKKLPQAVMRMKGIACRTIRDDGTVVPILDKSFFKNLFEGKTVAASSSVLKRSLFGERAGIFSSVLTRRVRKL